MLQLLLSSQVGYAVQKYAEYDWSRISDILHVFAVCDN